MHTRHSTSDSTTKDNRSGARERISLRDAERQLIQGQGVVKAVGVDTSNKQDAIEMLKAVSKKLYFCSGYVFWQW